MSGFRICCGVELTGYDDGFWVRMKRQDVSRKIFQVFTWCRCVDDGVIH